MSARRGGARPPRDYSKWECTRCGAVSPPPRSDDGLCAWRHLQTVGAPAPDAPPQLAGRAERKGGM